MNYRLLTEQFRKCAADIRFESGVLSTAAAILMTQLPQLNWAGFYYADGDRLYLGPFSGKPACIEIPMGKGVCGTCAKEETTQLVPDVHQFKGHIACDSASQSEIVIPVYKNGALYAVMDIDSPVLNRFDEADKEGLEAFAAAVESVIVQKV